MAMTNEMIIMMESVRLMKEGVIKGTGKFAEAEINGKIEKFEIPEEIHTYERWRKMGYQVQKGQTSFIKFKVWFYTGRNGRSQEVEEGAENSRQQRGKCYMRMTAFFTADQVKPKDEEKTA
ncbi:MAG: hypothetical protein IKO36_03210 [Bacteroidaceae bacterium]|nr:hypothetical protein [Bacteroidaceae bacterium]